MLLETRKWGFSGKCYTVKSEQLLKSINCTVEKNRRKTLCFQSSGDSLFYHDFFYKILFRCSFYSEIRENFASSRINYLFSYLFFRQILKLSSENNVNFLYFSSNFFHVQKNLLCFQNESFQRMGM
jgi:hypothetical protein